MCVCVFEIPSELLGVVPYVVLKKPQCVTCTHVCELLARVVLKFAKLGMNSRKERRNAVL